MQCILEVSFSLSTLLSFKPQAIFYVIKDNKVRIFVTINTLREPYWMLKNDGTALFCVIVLHISRAEKSESQ